MKSMKGLELSKLYYETYGKPMLEEFFSEVLPYIAVGLTGAGSECFGFDDEISQDHDFEPGFCLFLPDEAHVDRRTAFRLERAYAKLPKEFMGVKRGLLQPVGGARRGVIRAADYFEEKVMTRDGRLTLEQWLSLPDYALAEATNGQLFYDGAGEVSEIRRRLSERPEDIRKKKLAGCLLLMGQSGQYNYDRCIRHGETGAAQLAVIEFVERTMETVFLLNRVYAPFYKWRFRAMRSLRKLSLLAEIMEYLLTTENGKEMAKEKQAVMESVASDIIRELKNQGLSKANCSDLEKHAYSVQDGITDESIRNMHILAAA